MSAALRLPAFFLTEDGFRVFEPMAMERKKIVRETGKICRRRCERFGTVYDTLELPGGHVAHSYVTNNCWGGKNAIVTARVKSLTDFSCEFVRTDLETGEEEVITRGRWPEFAVKNGNLYQFFGKEVLRTNMKTKKTEVLWSGGYELSGPISVSEDEKRVSVSWFYGDGTTSVGFLDTEKGQHTEVYRGGFAPPFQDISHVTVSPRDHNKIFFCHEGTTQYITNRLWMADADTGHVENIFRQRLDAEGNNGECVGHEMWSPDGKGMYFIKYISTSILPKGVWYLDVYTREEHCVASKYDYWHVGVSPVGNLLAADTQIGGNHSEVILIDQAKGEEIPLVFAKTNWTHPCHPHPVFNCDGTKVCFETLNDEGNLCVGIVDLTPKYGSGGEGK